MKTLIRSSLSALTLTLTMTAALADPPPSIPATAPAAAVSVAPPAVASAAPIAPPAVQPLSWSQLQAMPLPPPGGLIPYGAMPQQFGELRLPTAGTGPFPVVVLIHGGCWQNEFDYRYITRLAEWMTTQGFATWTIEYARLGDEGGGWPGTFIDVARAADALQPLANTAPLDLTHVYAAGHSAGGQLALWLASRKNLPTSSALYIKDPLPIRGVLGIAAITDLEEYRKGPPDSCHASVEKLLGGTPYTVATRYSETSPLRRLPLGIRQVFIQGDKDPIVDAESVRNYVVAANSAGDIARLLTLPAGGHFDAAVPTAMSEAALRTALEKLHSEP